MKEETLEKRKILKKLSDQAILKSKGTDKEGSKVNTLLSDYFYNPSGKLIFKTFNDWKKEGYKIKKGSKAFLFWGTPKEYLKLKEKKQGEDPEQDNEIFFPLAFLFSSEQVEK
jgi:hypothetical protein